MSEYFNPTIESAEPDVVELKRLEQKLHTFIDRIPYTTHPVIRSQQITDIGRELNEFQHAHGENLSEDDPERDSTDLNRVARFYHLGHSLLMHELVEQKVRAVKADFRAPVKAYFDHLELLLNASAVTVRIGNVAHTDLVDLKRMEKLPDNDPEKLRLIDVYRFLTQAPRVGLSDDREEDHFAENAEFATEFPHLTKRSIFAASSIAFYVLTFADQEDVQAFRPSSEITRRSIQQVDTVLRNIAKIRRTAHNIVFNPEAVEFPEFKEEIERNLAEEDNEELLTFTTLYFLLPSSNPDGVRQSYRKCIAKIAEGIHPDFYAKIAERLQSMFSSTGISTEDAQILANGHELEHIPSLSEIRKRVIEITERTKDRDFSLDREAAQNIFNAYGIEPPAKVSIQIDNPNQYSVKLEYETETSEEPLEVEFYFDKKKDDLRFDWNVFNGPYDANLATLRNTALAVTKAMFDQLKRKVDAEFEHKKAAKIASPPVSVPTVKRAREIRESTSEPKPRVQREIEKPLTPFQQALLGVLEPREETAIKNQIVVADDIDGLRSLSPEDQMLVRSRIEEFNEGKRRARFKMVKHVRKDGEPSYSIAVGTKSGQWVRVLMVEDTEDGSEKGRRFNAYRVGYRGSGIYD